MKTSKQKQWLVDVNTVIYEKWYIDLETFNMTWKRETCNEREREIIRLFYNKKQEASKHV